MRVLVVGGSDAGIEAGLQASARGADVELLVADAYPNFSVCGIPYYLSGEVSDWHDLAHRDRAALEGAGLTLHLNTRATRINIGDQRVQAVGPRGEALEFGYDRLVVATGALRSGPPSPGWAPSARTPACTCYTRSGMPWRLAAACTDRPATRW